MSQLCFSSPFECFPVVSSLSQCALKRRSFIQLLRRKSEAMGSCLVVVRQTQCQPFGRFGSG